jgi:hypothetical protein
MIIPDKKFLLLPLVKVQFKLNKGRNNVSNYFINLAVEIKNIETRLIICLTNFQKVN